MNASDPRAFSADARAFSSQAARLRDAGSPDAVRFDRIAAVLNARAAGITDPAQLRAASRAAATRATAR
jgi:hypothetical protein